MLQHLEKNLRRDVVREISDHTHSVGKQRAQLHAQEIARHEPRRKFGIVGTEVVDALGVDLGAPHDDVAAPQQELRQHAHAASHLQHRRRRLGRTARQGVADFARYVQIDQKMLAQSLFRPDFTHSAIVLRNPAAHRAPPHGKGNYFDAIICGDGTFLLILEPVTPFIVMAYDIFISYRRDGGKELARPLKSELELRGYRVFLDFDELKDGVFDRRIMEAIDAAPIFMVILSPHALDRCANADDWVRREIEYALEHDRHFIPIDPDRSFTGFPPDIPDTLKAGLGQHQFSQVMFEQLFKVSVDKMVRERIEPLLQRAGRTAMQEQGGALFHVETDLPCRILKFGKELCTVRPGSDTVIRLRKGRHKLEAVCLDCPDDRLQWVQTVEDNEMEDLLTVELRPVRERRLAAEADVLAERGQTAYDAGDYAEAVKLWCEAAEAGNRIAQNSLGDCYYYGKGVAKDYTEAVKWYRKAAEQGYASAQNNLGTCYHWGKGVERDDAEAVKWYRKAAEQGYAVAQFEMGWCYKHGYGVPKDLAEAKRWYRKAADAGIQEAKKHLAELGG